MKQSKINLTPFLDSTLTSVTTSAQITRDELVSKLLERSSTIIGKECIFCVIAAEDGEELLVREIQLDDELHKKIKSQARFSEIFFEDFVPRMLVISLCSADCEFNKHLQPKQLKILLDTNPQFKPKSPK